MLGICVNHFQKWKLLLLFSDYAYFGTWKKKSAYKWDCSNLISNQLTRIPPGDHLYVIGKKFCKWQAVSNLQKESTKNARNLKASATNKCSEICAAFWWTFNIGKSFKSFILDLWNLLFSEWHYLYRSLCHSGWQEKGRPLQGQQAAEETMKQKYDGKGNMWPCFFDMNTYFFLKLAQNLSAAVMAHNYGVKTIFKSKCDFYYYTISEKFFDTKIASHFKSNRRYLNHKCYFTKMLTPL